MIIKGGEVFNAKGFFEYKDLLAEDGIITDKQTGDVCIDASEMYIIPGLIDIHFHGCMGADLCDGTKEALDTITEYEICNGITSICPASMTYDEKKLKSIYENVASYSNANGAEIIGINMEGPFISKEKKAAQNEEYICAPDVEMFRRLNDASKGLIKTVCLAPEAEGADEFIASLSKEVHISLGHTASNYKTADHAFKLGADHVTHLYNGMNSLHHRDSGVIGAALDNEGTFVELIGDGVHVSDTVVRATYKMFGDERVILISDSMRACGMPDGESELGGQKVIKNKELATLEDGTIAGSVMNLMDDLKTIIGMGISPETVVKSATINPAKSLGIDNQYGSLEIGKKADILILDKEMNLKYVIKNGSIVKKY